MRSHALRIAACAIFLAGYSYGQSLPTRVTQNEGTTLRMAVLTFSDEVEKCYLETPQGMVVEFTPKDESNDKYEKSQGDDISNCRVNLNDIDINDNGIWTIVAVLTTGSKQSQSYNLSVIPHPDDSGESTTTTTAVDTLAPSTPVIENLPHKYFDSNLGTSHTVFIRDYDFVTSEKCFVITPSGTKYNLQGLNLPNVEVINHRDATCAIKITVNSEDFVGNWTLIDEGSRYSDDIIRRQPFTIRVEETVDASIRDVIVVEGNDFYVRLRNPIHNYDTCRLLRPDGKECDTYEIDERYIENCGYVVRNVNKTDSGNWEIIYGDNIIYRAPINVTVNVATSEGSSNLIWTRDKPVNVTLGAGNAIYCRLRNPEGSIAYDGFGSCRVVIDRVTYDHDGIWKMSVGLPGRVLTENSEITVTVVEADSKPLVESKVRLNKPFVSLKCKVWSPHPIRSCKFRDPSGRILLANEGIGESRYSFHGAGVIYESDVHTHDCGLQIKDPVVQDLGLWRCAVETEEETYYGFLRVLCPWVMRDPEVAATIVMPNPARIAGGTVAQISDYPFATALLSNQGQGTYLQACGGTIISPTAILSAASCFVTNNAVHSVVWWRARVGTANSNAQGLIYLIRQITAHSNFQPTTRVNDIAVLRTSLNIVFGQNVQSAYIAGGAYSLATNVPVWAIGWGATSNTVPSSTVLRHVQIWVNDQQVCATRYNEVNFVVNNTMLCAGWLDIGVRGQCLGDTGSPLLHNGVVVGVYSWTQGCGGGRYPNINTRVSSYSRWIEATANA